MRNDLDRRIDCSIDDSSSRFQLAPVKRFFSGDSKKKSPLYVCGGFLHYEHNFGFLRSSTYFTVNAPSLHRILFFGGFSGFSGKLAFFSEPTKDSPTYPIRVRPFRTLAPLTPYLFVLFVPWPHLPRAFVNPKGQNEPSHNLATT